MASSLNYQLGDKHPQFDEVMELMELTNQTLRYNLSQIAPDLTQAIILIGDDSMRPFIYGMLAHSRAMAQTGIEGLWESDETEIVRAIDKAIAVLDRTGEAI